MPSLTFDKLKPEKKERFLQIALAEFGQNSYESASITCIVEQLGIAKGSVYQYFENKKDLYFYLLEYTNRQKQMTIAEVLKKSYPDFFEMYAQISLAGTRFDLANPLYSQFLHNVTQERHSLELGDLHQITFRQSLEYFKNLLQTEQQKGNIRSDIEADTMAFLIVQISSGILDFLKFKNLTENKNPQDIDNQLFIFFQDLKEIFKHGMSK